VTVLLPLGFVLYLGRSVTGTILPSLRETAVMQANSLASDILAESMDAVIREYRLDETDLVTYFRKEDGDIFAYTVDTVTINRVTAAVIARMNERVAEEEEIVIRIPLGMVLNQPILAACGIHLPIRIRLSGNTGAEYAREFTSAGINEINHRIWIRMEISVQVVAPLLSEVLTSRMDFPLVDQYLSGSMPLTYLGVAP
jgi:sporulation protein YunB